MNSDSQYLRQWLTQRLERLFESRTDLEAVVNWLSAHRGRPKVALIGSGFSRNAVLRPGEAGTVEERVPLWPHVSRLLRNGLGYFDPVDGPSDPLLIAEQYQESRGRSKLAEVLLDMLRDAELEPGPAHAALANLSLEAIITTNQLDTLLDKLKGEWFPVITNTDLPVARSRASRTPASPARQVIYLHGHRSAPQGWVFSRGEYERIHEEKPALMRRVQQLLCEYPLLIMGYSLSDPDFHWMFSGIHREQGKFMPRALCITVGSPPMDPERAHWREMGMHLAHMAPKAKDGPNGRTISDDLADLLSADVEGPRPDDLVRWLRQVQAKDVNEAATERLDMLDDMVREVSSSGPEDGDLAKRIFELWVACLPTYEPQEGEPQAADREVDDTGMSFSHLPDAVAEVVHGADALSLAQACNSFLARGGSESILKRWLIAGARWRVRNRAELVLGDTFVDAFNRIFASFAGSGVGVTSEHAPEGAMQAAVQAAWDADFQRSAELYGEAADAFERRGDHVGAYWARTSRTHALHAGTLGAASESSETWAHVRLERARTLQLNLTPSVVRDVARRGRIFRGALHELSTQQSTRDSPFTRTFRANVAHPELEFLLAEEIRAAVFPGIPREPASILLLLAGPQGAESPELVKLGLDYEIKQLGDLLCQQVHKTLDLQSERDRALSACLVEQSHIESAGAPSAECRVSLLKLLPKVVHRLTSGAVAHLARWVVTEATHGAGASLDYTTAFGFTSTQVLGDTFCALLRVLPTAEGGTVMQLLADFTATFERDPTPEWRFWSQCDDVLWNSILSMPGVSFDAVLTWHLDTKISYETNETRDAWRASLWQLLACAPADTRLDDVQRGKIERHLQQLDPALPEVFDFREVLHEPGVSLGSAFDVAPWWPAHARLALAQRIAEQRVGPNGVISLTPELIRAFEEDSNRALEKHPKDWLLRSRVFETLCLGLALGIGDAAAHRARLLELIGVGGNLPLWRLAPSILSGRWTDVEGRPLTVKLLESASHTIGEVHVIGLFEALVRLAPEAAWAHLDVPEWGMVIGMALRCLDADESDSPVVGARALARLLLALPVGGPTAGLRPLLVRGVQRCISHPNTFVRSTIAYSIGAHPKLTAHPELHQAVASLKADDFAMVDAAMRTGQAAQEPDAPQLPTAATDPKSD